MKEFFKVKTIDEALQFTGEFPRMQTEKVALIHSPGRVLAEDIQADIDLPDFPRATMDGFAVRGSSTFGASEGNPAYLTLKGAVAMGESTQLCVGAGEAARIATGGMLPEGSDSVVMLEHTEAINDTTIEVYRSVAPGQNMVAIGEDIRMGSVMLSSGGKIRPQEAGLLAALGREIVTVFKRPVIGIISTGDEIAEVGALPGPGQVRDINTFTMAGLAQESGATVKSFGIVRDDYQALFEKCSQALSQCDMVLVSGGSSVGARDFTIEVITAFKDASILFHGISISPGKPTILAKIQNKAFWGLPGHVVSAMIVYARIVKPFVEHVSGLCHFDRAKLRCTAMLSRNVSSAQGRVDYIRVRLIQKEGSLWAEPILGKSGLIHTMVKADGLIEIGMNTEGLDQGTEVEVIPF